MPICNPIKRSAALLQSRYDSLPPRGTDRESGATQVCLCLGEGICVVKIHTIMAGATCVYVCEWGRGGVCFIPLSRAGTGSPRDSERSAGSAYACQGSRFNLI